MIILSFLNQSLHLTPRPPTPRSSKPLGLGPAPSLIIHRSLYILFWQYFSASFLPRPHVSFSKSISFFSLKKMFIIKITISNVKNLTPLIRFLIKSYPRDWISTCAAYNSFAFYGSSWYELHHFTGGTRKNLQLIKAVVQTCPKTARSCSPLNLL